MAHLSTLISIPSRIAFVCAALLLLSSCGSLEYDLSTIAVPVSAKPADSSAGATQPFEIDAKSVLWAHGLFGQSTPDVAALLVEKVADHDRIASFRVRVGASFHDWLITHLTLTLVRMKTVVIEGVLVKDGGT